jgi:hypothetical protein
MAPRSAALDRRTGRSSRTDSHRPGPIERPRTEAACECRFREARSSRIRPGICRRRTCNGAFQFLPSEREPVKACLPSPRPASRGRRRAGPPAAASGWTCPSTNLECSLSRRPALECKRYKMRIAKTKRPLLKSHLSESRAHAVRLTWVFGPRARAARHLSSRGVASSVVP